MIAQKKMDNNKSRTVSEELLDEFDTYEASLSYGNVQPLPYKLAVTEAPSPLTSTDSLHDDSEVSSISSGPNDHFSSPFQDYDEIQTKHSNNSHMQQLLYTKMEEDSCLHDHMDIEDSITLISCDSTRTPQDATTVGNYNQQCSSPISFTTIPIVNMNACLSPSSTSAPITDVESNNGMTNPDSEVVEVIERTKFGDMTNGKTSIYRGVTRTSKSAWGSKFSSKRIISTCKTQEEAARAYDAYLKVHVPKKYKKFANFCPICDKFCNSLGLRWVSSECTCVESKKILKKVKRKKSIKILSNEESTQNIDLDFTDFVALSIDATPEIIPSPEPSHYPKFSTNDEEGDEIRETLRDLSFNDYLEVLEDSTTLDDDLKISFSRGDSMDEIVQCVETNTIPTLGGTHSTSTLGGTHSTPTPTLGGTHSMYTNHLIQEVTPTTNASLPPPTDNNSIPTDDSLYFLNELPVFHSEPIPYSTPDKVEFPSNLDLNSLPLHPPLCMDGSVRFKTQFLQKYWRNDRKNIQCFPFCPEFGDYSIAKLENRKHTFRGVCRAPVDVEIVIPNSIDLSRIVVLCRCCTDDATPFVAGSQVALYELELLHESRYFGKLLDVQASKENHVATYQFLPDNWKFEDELSKKRRKLTTDPTLGCMEHDYILEVEVLYLVDDCSHYVKLLYGETHSFKFGSTRTLLRHRNKYNLVENDNLPERKKVKMEFSNNCNSLISESNLLREPSIIEEECFDSDTSDSDTSDSIQPAIKPASQTASHSPDYQVSNQTITNILKDTNNNNSNHDIMNDPSQLKTPVNSSTTTAAVNTQQQLAVEQPSSKVVVPSAWSNARFLAIYLLRNALFSLASSCICLLFLLFSIFPWIFIFMVRFHDTLGDLELMGANTVDSKINPSFTHSYLRRIQYRGTQGLARWWICIRNRDVWKRVLYFSWIKVITSLFFFIGCITMYFIGMILYVIPFVSNKLVVSSNSLALCSIRLTKNVLGRTDADDNLQQFSYGKVQTPAMVH